MNCNDVQLLGRTLQTNYSGVFTAQDASPEMISSNVMNTIRHDSELAKSCKSAS